MDLVGQAVVFDLDVEEHLLVVEFGLLPREVGRHLRVTDRLDADLVANLQQSLLEPRVPRLLYYREGSDVVDRHPRLLQIIATQFLVNLHLIPLADLDLGGGDAKMSIDPIAGRATCVHLDCLDGWADSEILRQI